MKGEVAIICSLKDICQYILTLSRPKLLHVLGGICGLDG